MNTYCRICLIGEGKIKIFGKEFVEESVNSKIMTCASVKVFVDDGLPSMICADCLKNLNVAYNFRKQCEESDVRLRQMLIKNDANDLKLSVSNALESKIHYEGDIKIVEPPRLELVGKSCSTSNNENIISEDTDYHDENVGIAHLNESDFNVNDAKSLISNKITNYNIQHKVKKTQVKLKSNLKKLKVSYGNNDKSRKIFNCEICSKSYNSRKQMRRHQIIHGDKKQYTCHVCNKEFHFKANLLVHERIHTGERPFLCNTCGKLFVQVAGLQRHLAVHNDEKPFACNMCNKRFKLADSLTCHERTHTMERPYSCQKCGKAFSHHSGLNKHVRVHTGEKNYQCKQCGKFFSRSDSLTEHVKIHTGERPHQCTTCSAAFSSKSTLKVHIRTHTSERPYKCSLCEKSFSQSSVLSRHMRTHTGERPYSCTKCGLSFSLNVRLIEHMHSVHNNKNLGNVQSTEAITNSNNTRNRVRYYCEDDQQHEVQQNCSTNPVLLTSNSNTNCSHNFRTSCNNSNNVINLNSNCTDMTITAQNEPARYFDSMKMNPYFTSTVLHFQV